MDTRERELKDSIDLLTDDLESAQQELCDMEDESEEVQNEIRNRIYNLTKLKDVKTCEWSAITN